MSYVLGLNIEMQEFNHGICVMTSPFIDHDVSFIILMQVVLQSLKATDILEISVCIKSVAYNKFLKIYIYLV